MVELIIHPNPRIDKGLLFDSIKEFNEKTGKAILLRVLKSEIQPHDEETDSITIYIEVLHNNFICNAYYMVNGEIDKTKTQRVKASWETIECCYLLKKDNNDKYIIERNDPIFRLANYGLQEHKRMIKGNNQGFIVSEIELKNALNGLTFGGAMKQFYGVEMLMPIGKHADELHII